MNDPRSAFDDVTRCSRGCGATAAYWYPSADTERQAAWRSGLIIDIPERDVTKDDAEFRAHLLQSGWAQDGDAWICPNHGNSTTMAKYRTGSHWGTTVIREGSAPADESGRRDDDELALQVIDADRPREEREMLAERVAELLTVVEAACDCGHEGLDLMFHLHPCPVAVLRNAARKR